MAVSQLVRPLLRAWTAENSTVALRTKQVIASVLPERMLLELKKRYYLKLLRNDSDELMESDAKALPRFVKPGDFVIDVGGLRGTVITPDGHKSGEADTNSWSGTWYGECD